MTFKKNLRTENKKPYEVGRKVALVMINVDESAGFMSSGKPKCCFILINKRQFFHIYFIYWTDIKRPLQITFYPDNFIVYTKTLP